MTANIHNWDAFVKFEHKLINSSLEKNINLGFFQRVQSLRNGTLERNLFLQDNLSRQRVKLRPFTL